MTGVAPADRGAEAVERVFRESYGQAVATLVRLLGDITQAEDAVQEAFVVATERWPREGFPPNPTGWIITTARNRAIDDHRRATRGRELYAQIGSQMQSSAMDGDWFTDDGPVNDDRLRLIFTCCHPALRREHQVALTLRLLGGMSVDQVARSFLVSEAAMAKRLVRAKYKIKAANIPYRVPREPDLPVRIRSVLLVVYLIYNAGFDEPVGAPLRGEAIRLARSLNTLMPDEAEAAGLLALLLLSESRAHARTAGDEVVLLRDQDRSMWDRSMIDEGHAIVRACVRRDDPGPFQVQAAIQAVHCDAASVAETDWDQIVDLYDHLMSLVPTPVVAMNRAIAIGETDGPAAALAQLDALAPELDSYHLMHASRAAMLQRLGRSDEAVSAYERAVECATTDGDVRMLQRRLSNLSGIQR